MLERWTKVKAERVFIDTNLFLRYLTNDVPAQADAVEALLQQAAGGEMVLVTNNLVIAEIVWVLATYYQHSRVDIRDKVLAVLNTPGLKVVDGDLVLQAVTWFAEEDIDFIDAYNAAWLLRQDMNVAYTFDHGHFSRIEGITVRVPGAGGG
jgi:predicted nucleic acid-binding protein